MATYLGFMTPNASARTSSIPINSTVRHANCDGQAHGHGGPLQLLLVPTFISSICTDHNNLDVASHEQAKNSVNMVD